MTLRGGIRSSNISYPFAVSVINVIHFELPSHLCFAHLYLLLIMLSPMQKSGTQLSIHRSHSVPVLNKDGSIRQGDSLGGVFRVVPTTPRAAEGTPATLTTSPTNNAGNC